MDPFRNKRVKVKADGNPSSGDDFFNFEVDVLDDESERDWETISAFIQQPDYYVLVIWPNGRENFALKFSGKEWIIYNISRAELESKFLNNSNR